MGRRSIYGILLIGLVVWPSALLAQQTYPLVCKGGPDMRFSLAVNADSTTVTIRFKRAAHGVGTVDISPGWLTLKPGECSWVDRRVEATEPDVILHTVKQPPFFSLSWVGQGSLLVADGDTVQLGSAAIPRESTLAERHVYILRLLSESATFQVFQVYNDGHGYFIVTKVQ